MKKKICIPTATRAEYGLLKPVIEGFCKYDDIEILTVVTGSHLSHEFGYTVRDIEADGIKIDKKIEILLSSDSSVAVSKAMGLAIMSFAEYFDEKKPDLVVILGDRYEMLAIAIAAMNARIPIAHLYGGDVSEGALDDNIRHSLTKLSQLHFCATKDHFNRILQMGENKDNVYCVGTLAVENSLKVPRLSMEELEESLGLDLVGKRVAIVTYHPVTLEPEQTENHIKELLRAVEKHKELFYIFTKANADSMGRLINDQLTDYVRNHNQNSALFDSLGQKRYLSLLAYATMVIGNSSSGLSEAPSFHIPTINVGNRQKGRQTGDTVISCGNESEEIDAAITMALTPEFTGKIQNAVNPYEQEGTSQTIVSTIHDRLLNGEIELMKHFFTIN